MTACPPQLGGMECGWYGSGCRLLKKSVRPIRAENKITQINVKPHYWRFSGDGSVRNYYTNLYCMQICKLHLYEYAALVNTAEQKAWRYAFYSIWRCFGFSNILRHSFKNVQLPNRKLKSNHRGVASKGSRSKVLVYCRPSETRSISRFYDVAYSQPLPSSAAKLWWQ